MLSIRAATSYDFPDMVGMGEKMHSEGAYSFLPYDSDKLMNMATSMYGNGSGCFLVAEENGDKVGMVIAYLTEYYFCREKIVKDLLVYVLPEYRGGTCGVRLIKELIKWSKESGARELCLGVTNGGDTGRIGRFYESIGCEQVGGLYKKRL